MDLPSIPPREKDNMAGPVNFLTPIIPKIIIEPRREYLIVIYRLISGNIASVAFNHGGGSHNHLALTVTTDYYLAHMGHTFVPPHNTGNYAPIMGATQ